MKNEQYIRSIRYDGSKWTPGTLKDNTSRTRSGVSVQYLVANNMEANPTHLKPHMDTGPSVSGNQFFPVTLDIQKYSHLWNI